MGFTTVACASTGNLANAVAAHAARVGLRAFVFHPADLESAKVVTTAVYGGNVVAVKGNYDQVNRLCSEIAQTLDWGFRERQPAAVLLRRLQDAGVRGRRAARVGGAGTTSWCPPPPAPC